MGATLLAALSLDSTEQQTPTSTRQQCARQYEVMDFEKLLSNVTMETHRTEMDDQAAAKLRLVTPAWEAPPTLLTSETKCAETVSQTVTITAETTVTLFQVMGAVPAERSSWDTPVHMTQYCKDRSVLRSAEMESGRQM